MKRKSFSLAPLLVIAAFAVVPAAAQAFVHSTEEIHWQKNSRKNASG